MNVKKYTNNTWREITPYKYSTSVETYTDLPQIIYANGNSASIGLKGALSQSGVPSPTNPIQPQECGDLETTGEKAGQYKIPILSANTTTPVYLGGVQTTREVKKYEFTGNEAFYASSQTSVFYTTQISTDCNKSFTYNTGCIINAYKLRKQSTAANLLDGEFTTDTNGYLWFRNYDYTTLTDFKTYLQQQYAAGTPVTVWYVLATVETGTVNEPLRKIGDYADTLSNVSIPVTAGGDTLSIGTTLQPSEVTVNYKGWHPVADVHEKSKNLFDKSKRADNSRVVYTTGEISALSGVFVSDFTPIEPNTTYMLNIVSSISSKTGHLFALYDENKNFVNTGAHEATSVTVYTFTTPSNVAYIRFNGNMASADEIMFNTGSSTLPYEPYWK